MKIKTLTGMIFATAFLVSSTPFAAVTNLPCIKNVEADFIDAKKTKLPDEDGYDFWLRYAPATDKVLLNKYRDRCKAIVVLENGAILDAGATELSRGISKMTGTNISIVSEVTHEGTIILATGKSFKHFSSVVASNDISKLQQDGYVIRSGCVNGKAVTVICGTTECGALYGAFHFLRLMQTEQNIDSIDVHDEPQIALRMVNHWDNPRGDVERGYAGSSIFHWDNLPRLEERYTDYARMLASIGINACVVNNVNTYQNGALNGWRLITDAYLKKVAALASVFRPYGIRIYLSVNFASPIITGDLATADPLDPKVQAWWTKRANAIYKAIPDFGGFLVKADSEGEAGPLTYGRTQTDGANMLGKSLEPHDGLVIWRAFVYGVKDLNPDRAAQAHQFFQPLDGKFAENVILQIKNGPLDFQVREAVSPLFGAMPKTNPMLEFQITQEYLGFSTHAVYLVPLWKEVLNFDTHAKGKGSKVSCIVTGELFDNRHAGMTGVMNIGSERNWTGHHLAAANTFGYGRLAWNPALSAETIAEEFVRMTFGSNPVVVKTIVDILMQSWHVYEQYTSSLGMNLLCNLNHYDPDPVLRENYHRADAKGVGYDRTSATGSKYAGQYSKPVSLMYESPESCPEELLLWFHHVPYTHKLKSGKTVIQHIYDEHNNGVKNVERYIDIWKGLKGLIDNSRYAHILSRFEDQHDHAIVWRDSINGYFRKRSGIDDKAKKK